MTAAGRADAAHQAPRQQQQQQQEFHLLCAWASTLTVADIPPDMLARAALVIADDMACAIGAGHEADLVAILGASGGLRPGHRRESTVFAPQPWRTGRADAAMLNAIRANWCQFDEGHRSVMCHAGLYAVPAALAEAEAAGQSMAEVLRAVVVAYDITCRFALAWRFEGAAPHPHAVWSAVGSCAALAVLRGFDARQFQQALSMAAACARAAPFAWVARGEPAANAWVGWGVTDGFRCADMAAFGVTATGAPPSATFQGLLAASYQPGVLAAGLGAQWAVAGNYHKPLACAGQAMAAVEALLELRHRLGAAGPLPLPERITADVHQAALLLDHAAPHTSLGARFSLPHLLAYAWLHGTRGLQTGSAVAGDTGLDALGLEEDAVMALRQRVHLAERLPRLPSPHDRAATVRLLMGDGSLHVQDCLSAYGGPDRPMNGHAVLAKSRALAGCRWPAFFDWLEQCALAPAPDFEARPGDLLTLQP